MPHLKSYGLGLARDGAVKLAPANPRWPEAFTVEAARLRKALPQEFEIHHIGSTAIPGLSAKPILDILVVAPKPEAMDRYQKDLEALGYEYKGEYGIPGRRYCVLYNEDKTVSYAHLHAFAQGSQEAASHLLFRDHLRAHPECVKEYEALKQSLVSQIRSVYTESKAPWIQQVLRRANNA